MDNAYKGQSPLFFGEYLLTLVYDWDALARVQLELGEEGQAKALGGDPDLLAKLVSIGLEHHHPEWTAERIKSEAPPIIPTIRAVEKALTYAFFGPDGPPKAEEPANPPVPPQTRLNRLWRRLLRQG